MPWPSLSEISTGPSATFDSVRVEPTATSRFASGHFTPVRSSPRRSVNGMMLNRVLAEAVKANPPHIAKNRTPKLFFATQVATEPPTIVVKVNNPELFSPAWERYLLGKFREELPFKEVPIRLYFRGKTKEDEET